MPDVLLFTITLGFLGGVVTSANLFVGGVLSCALWVGIFYFGRRQGLIVGSVAYSVIMICFAAAFVLGCIRFSFTKVVLPEFFEDRIGEEVRVSGVVKNDPMDGEGEALAILYLDGIGLRTKFKTTQTISYGDHVTVSGILAYPENFLTEQGTEFDYVSYLRKDAIFYLVGNGKLLEHIPRKSFSLLGSLYSLRHSVENVLFSSFREREAGLLAGILLGTKTSIDESLYNALVHTSTVHIVALSGYNVSIVAETIARAFNTFLRPQHASLFGGIGIVLFVLMTGASSTALRAGCMALLVILARSLGRPVDALRIMAIAALGLVLYNPWYVVSDASFQLSFLATLGLVLVSPKTVAWCERYMPKVVAEAVGTTIAAEIAVVPFIVYNMGVFSVVALPVNILIIPVVPILMLGGFIAICVGFISPIFGLLVGYPTQIIAQLLIEGILLVGSFPFASISVTNISFIVIALIYIWIGWYFTEQLLTKRQI